MTPYPAATLYTFGVSSVVTGITLDSVEQNDQIDVFEQKDQLNETVEIVTHNMRSELTLSGEATSALPKILGTALTLTGLVTTQVGTAGLTIVTGVNYSSGRAKNQGVRITARHYPLVTA
jgi:hypothetical protein